jgi:hypothetical protein
MEMVLGKQQEQYRCSRKPSNKRSLEPDPIASSLPKQVQTCCSEISHVWEDWMHWGTRKIA